MMLRPRIFFLAVAAVAASLAGATAAAEQAVPISDRTDLSLTVYNADLALVRDRRRVPLIDGTNLIAFVGVSGQLRPETAVLAGAAGGAAIRVVEQNFEFDRLTPLALLRKSVGRKVRVIRTHPTTGEDREVEATVLSAADGVVLKIGDRIETGHPGRIVFDKVSPDLRAEPALVALVQSNKGGTMPLELAYLTGGVRWQADYVAEIDEAGQRLDLKVFATLANTSGAAYDNARLNLVAGDVHRVEAVPRPRLEMAGAQMARAAAPADVPSEKVADLHVFALERPVTLADNQSKQILLMTGRGIPFEKEYRLDGRVQAGRMRGPERPGIGAWLTFRNDEEAALGKPLPRGTVRVYQRRPDAGLFLGEDRIGHTPVRETVRVNLGRAFDLTAERKQVAFSREGLGKNVFESTFEITLRNGGTEDALVTVFEHIPGDWTMISSSQIHEKFDAATARWRVEVPAAGETKLSYRVRARL